MTCSVVCAGAAHTYGANRPSDEVHPLGVSVTQRLLFPTSTAHSGSEQAAPQHPKKAESQAPSKNLPDHNGIAIYQADRTCPVQTFRDAGTDLGRAAGRDLFRARCLTVWLADWLTD